MDRTKLTAFLLLMLSLGMVLLAFFMAAGPFLLIGMGEYPGGLPPGCMAVAMLVLFLLFAGIPGACGLIIWLRTVRRRAVERARELASWSEQETLLQNCYDRLVLALVDAGDKGELFLIHKATEQLGTAQRARWHRFLAVSEAPGQLFLRAAQERGAEPVIVSERGVRTLAFTLSLFGFLCFLCTALVVVGQLVTESSRLVGVAPGLEGAWIGASGCLIPGITTVIGGVGLMWMLRRERRRRATEEKWRDRARQVLLDECMRRLERIGERGLATMSEGATLQKVAQASIFDALAELDGGRKASLLLALHTQGFTKMISLQGADLRGAKLEERMDLNGASLTGIDFSEAVLTRIRLEKSDLRSCRFVGADLRASILRGADLRQCDLRSARLHRCDLRSADLRNTDLRGANLWQADLSGADLRDSFVSPEQLMASSSLDGASLPLELPLMRGAGKTAEI
jgi:uncharacterized protein YjbI with pentapeptide repeats